MPEAVANRGNQAHRAAGGNNHARAGCRRPFEGGSVSGRDFLIGAYESAVEVDKDEAGR